MFGENPVPVPLLPSEIAHGMAWTFAAIRTSNALRFFYHCPEHRISLGDVAVGAGFVCN